MSENKQPTVKKVFFTDDQNIALDKETELIKYYGKRVDGTGPLANITDGGIGGDTVSGVDPLLIQARYEKRAKTLNSRSDKEKKRVRNIQSTASISRWQENRQEMLDAIRKGIKENRDRDNHAIAVRRFWANRTDEEKQETSRRKSESRKLIWKDPVKRENLLNGTRSITKPTRITKPSGEIILIESLRKWCTENNESYNSLEEIRSGKPRKTKRAKYFNWKVEEIKND